MAINFLLNVLDVLTIFIKSIYQAYIDGPEGAEPSPRLGEYASQ
jgi:hypothetical protein